MTGMVIQYDADRAIQERVRLKQFRAKLARWLCACGAVLLFGWLLTPVLKIGFNTSESLDGYVYLILKNTTPRKNHLIAFWPPEEASSTWAVKYVKGVAGDMVVRRNQSFFINDNYIGDAKTVSNQGTALEAADHGVIPINHYFVWSPHVDSFDSRYKQIGWIPESRLIGRAYRIF